MVDFGKEVIIALAIGAVGLLFSLVSGIFHVFSTLRLDKYQGELQAQQRQQLGFENVQELMEVYKKPLVESANELQLRLTLLLLSKRQISAQEERQHSYMLLSTLYLIGAFLSWLEVIRQEIVFVTGPGAATLNEIIAAIKFQFTGETVVQGFPGEGSAKSSLEYSLTNPWHIMQLYHVELRAIGEVMLSERTYDNDKRDVKSTNLAVIGYSEFVRRFSQKEPSLEEFTANGCEYGKFRTAKDQWESSKEKLLQHHLRPLTASLQKWLEIAPDIRPTERLAMLQVLLCKLIDFLDDGDRNGNGSSARGGRWNGECFLPRNEWLNPLLELLRRDALQWLWSRPFMEDCCPRVDPRHCREWLSLLHSRDPWKNRFGEDIPLGVFRRLAFPGFREDLRGRRSRGDAGAATTARERAAEPAAGGGGGRLGSLASTCAGGDSGGVAVGSARLLRNAFLAAAAFPPKSHRVTFFTDPKYYLQVHVPRLLANITCGVIQLREQLREDPFRWNSCPAVSGGSGGGSGTPVAASQRSAAVPPLSPPPAAHPRLPVYIINPVAVNLTAAAGRPADDGDSGAQEIDGGISGGGSGVTLRPLSQLSSAPLRV